MFEILGQFVERRWRALLIVWGFIFVVSVLAQAGLMNWAGLPRFKDVTQDGEFAYLPRTMPSIRGEAVLAKAFPADTARSSVVIVVRRESAPLQQQDRDFIDAPDADPDAVTLRNELEKIRQDQKLWEPRSNNKHGPKFPVIARIRTYADNVIGKLLDSRDGKASLVIVEFTSEFLEWRNRFTIDRIESLIDLRKGELAKAGKVPPGLDLAMSGTATVGRDMLVATRESSHATELWTIILVVLLLVGIYRAPILAIIPLVTVFASRQISLTLMVLLTKVPWLGIRVFMGMDVYMTVVLYGAGVDYCLFLIARYKEELEGGASSVQGVGQSVSRVGEAIVASAATVICGIGMMIFAQFGKYHEAGIGISLSLVVTLLASMLFTPALMCWAGRLAFWPEGMSEHIPGLGKNAAGTTLVGRLVVRDRFYVLWENVGRWLVRYPARILFLSILVMLPFAAIGIMFHNYMSYGLLSELPRNKQAVIGAQAVQLHFPPGYVAPVTVLLEHKELTFSNSQSEGREQLLFPIVDALKTGAKELGITDIRHVGEPLGQAHRPRGRSAVELAGIRSATNRFYVSSVEGLDGRLTRFEIITDTDPFSPESLRQLGRIEQAVRKAVPKDLAAGTQVHLVGATASIRDLKEVTDSDQIRIDVLVIVAVFVILVLLLRQVSLPVYLLLSVVFSYLVTLGITLTLFWALDPQGFSGLDWKVPVFLFTILIAVGEDYNIFLMTRISEEQRRHGPVEGIRLALLKTGGIISSCGVIMAGTFCSLLIAGRLMGMQQLGFALAFGVLLDTFVVRPILVPAYLIMLNSGELGPIGRWLGAVPTLSTHTEHGEPPASPDDEPPESPESPPVQDGGPALRGAIPPR